MIPAVTALLLLHPALPAGGGDDTSEWLELDREIASLAAAPLSVDGDAPKFELEAVILYSYSTDEFYAPGGENLSGVDLRLVRTTFSGAVGDYTYMVSGELSSGSMVLEDAYATWACSEMLDLTIGRFKNPLLWSARVSEFAEPFAALQVTAAQNFERQNGVMLESSIAAFDLLLALQNGVNGISEDSRFVGRAQWNLLGDNAFGEWHGAYGYGDQAQLSVAGGYFDDAGIDDGTGFSGELGLVMQSLSFRADMVSYADNYDVGTGLDPDHELGTSKAGTTPWVATLGYLFGDDAWEALVRQESFDDDSSTIRTSFGIVRYSEFGPKLRWALLYQDVTSDQPAFDGTRIELSLSLAGG